MSFNSKMNIILPPAGGFSPHITSSYGVTRSVGTSPHVGVDMNYNTGCGQCKINLTRPPVYSPTAGKVTFTHGNYGTVKIKDDKGFSHELLHMTRINVAVGATIAEGTLLGYMDSTGLGSKGAKHCHYQLRTPQGSITSPIVFWDDPNAAPSQPIPPEPPSDDKGNVEQPGGVAPPPAATERIKPTQASEASDSGADKALWTNRVPEHEPWPRVLKSQPQKDPNGTQAYDDQAGMTYQDADEARRFELNRHHTDEFSKDSAWVGRAEGNELMDRNPLWKR